MCTLIESEVSTPLKESEKFSASRAAATRSTKTEAARENKYLQ
jgi:hypothetical protein